MGITKDILQIFIICIKGRNYSVNIHDYMSGGHISLYGVPQRSILGHLLIIFIFLF